MLRTVAVLLVGLSASAHAAPWVGRARLVLLSTCTLGSGARTTAQELVVSRETGAHVVVEGPRAFGIASAIRHAKAGAVYGVLAGDDVLVTADEQATQPRDYTSAVWRVNRMDATRLVEGAVSAPALVVGTGAGRRAYVTVGRAGIDREDGSTREDEFVIDELDVEGGSVRPVAQLTGQLAEPLGVDEEAGLLVHAVTPHAASNVLVFDLHGGMPRELGSVGAAHEFLVVPRVGGGLGTGVVYDDKDGTHALLLDGQRVPYDRTSIPVKKDALSVRRIAGGFVVTTPDGADITVTAPPSTVLAPIGWLPR
ncbi:MAG: hypothetical protein ABI321_15955 [Polyangia bacterium]